MSVANSDQASGDTRRGPLSARSVDAPNSADSKRASGWLVSLAFDLLFIVNVGWLAALLPGYLAAEGAPHLEFWQIYFLTTPHRWITLLLVAVDGDRRAGRNWLFAFLAVVAAFVVCGLRAGTGSFACVLLIDFVWNYWHFAAQHAGVFRMYSRRAGGGRPRWETWSIRLFVFYVALRLGGWVAGWLEPLGSSGWVLTAADAVACVPVGALLLWQVAKRADRSAGKLAYLTSVVGLYGALLVAVRQHDRAAILALTVASAVFHAVEYLAIVTHYAWRRQHSGSAGLFQRMTQRWLELLVGYMLLLGLAAWALEQASPVVREVWIGLNLWAAALHYGFDGLIWKLRRPETAAALDVVLPSAADRPAPASTRG